MATVSSSSVSTRQICIPVLQPASGTYCPPLLITCVADLQPREEAWVVIQTPKQRTSQLYKSPFLVDEIGRVQITAFVRRPGICDGPSSSAIFELSLHAPPLGKSITNSLLRGGGGVGGSSLSQHLDPFELNASSYNTNTNTAASFTSLAIPSCQFAGLGVVPSLPGPSAAPRTFASLKPIDLALSVCDTSGTPIALMDPPTSAVVVLDVPEHSAVLTCKANIDVYGSEPKKILPSFQSLTDLVVSRETVRLPRYSSSEGAGGKGKHSTTTSSSMNLLSSLGGLVDSSSTISTSSLLHDALEMDSNVSGGISNARQRDNNFYYAHQAQAAAGGGEGRDRGVRSVPSMSLGKTSSRADTNGALGVSAPEIGVLSSASGCGVVFRIKHICKAAVGLDEPENAEDLRRGSRREIAHAFHFAGDIGNDPLSGIGGRGIASATSGEGFYKISDRTEPTRSRLETRSFRIGDCFSLTMRPSGDIDYIHNDRIIFTSRAKMGIESLLSLVVRIAEEAATPCISDIALVPPRTDQRFVIPSLVYNGPAANEAILRVWLSGKEFAPATAKVRLTSASLPKWAFATFSVAAMFAVGAFGCDGAKVADAMVATESETLQLFQTDNSASSSASGGFETLPQQSEKNRALMIKARGGVGGGGGGDRTATNSAANSRRVSGVSTTVTDARPPQRQMRNALPAHAIANIFPSNVADRGVGGTERDGGDYAKRGSTTSIVDDDDVGDRGYGHSYSNVPHPNPTGGHPPAHRVVVRGPAGSGDGAAMWANGNGSAAAVAADGTPRQYPSDAHRLGGGRSTYMYESEGADPLDLLVGSYGGGGGPAAADEGARREMNAQQRDALTKGGFFNKNKNGRASEFKFEDADDHYDSPQPRRIGAERRQYPEDDSFTSVRVRGGPTTTAAATHRQSEESSVSVASYKLRALDAVFD